MIGTRRVVAGVASAMVAALLLSTGVAAASVPAKELSAKKYAKTLCTNWITHDISAFTDKYNAISTSDPAELQKQAVAAADELLATLEAKQAKFKKLSPAVDNGKKIGKVFAKAIGQVHDEIKTAADTFRAADPNNVAFQGDVITFQTAVNILDAKVSDPFSEASKLTQDNDLASAFKGEPACKDIVQVFGG